MSGNQTSRVEVAFQARRYPDGRSYLALVLTRPGSASVPDDRLFTFDLTPDMTPDEAATLAQALNQCVTHLGMTTGESGA